MYIRVVGKILDSHFNVKLSSNPGDKVRILVESTGQICTIIFHLFWTLSPGLEYNKALKCCSSIFPTNLTYIVILENCRNNTSMYECSPCQGTRFKLLLNLIKPGSQSVTYDSHMTSSICKNNKVPIKNPV